MIILIDTPEKKIKIPIPNKVAFSPVGYYLFLKRLSMAMSYQDFKTISSVLKKHKGLTLIDVESSDTKVLIKL